MIEAYLIHILILMGIYSIIALSLQFALGYAGMLNLGHVALVGIGAYTSALLTLAGVPFVIAFIAAGVLAAIFGMIVVAATQHLKGDYYVLATLGFSFVMYSLFLNLTSITRGPLGLPGIPKPALFSVAFSSAPAYLFLVALVCIVMTLCIWQIVRSPFGTLLQAMRDDELSAKVLGKNVTALKYKAMFVSAFLAGLAGSLFAHYISYIDPSSFTLSEIILVITMVIVGGLASIKGTFIATFFILLVPELLRFLELPSSILGPARQILYALLLLLILLYKPRGIDGRIDLA